MKKLLAYKKTLITIGAAILLGSGVVVANLIAPTVPAGTVHLFNSSGAFISEHTTIQSCVGVAQSGYTCEAGAGDYRSNWSSFYRWTKSNVTLRCQSFNCRIRPIIFEGNGNTIQGFEISSDNFKNGIRTYGNYNLILQNEIHGVLEDAIWLWGTGNIVRDNYFHDIWALGCNAPCTEPFDNHIDGIMTDNTFSPSPIVKTAQDLVIDGNIIVMDRDHGSNAFFMLNAGGNQTVLPKNITWKNNIFICKDAGFCPIAIFGDSTTTGMKIFNNKFYNTTNRGESAVWMQNAAAECEINGNQVYGYDTLERPGNFCAKTGNTVLPFAGLPVIVWPPSVGQTLTPTPTPSSTPIPSTLTPSITPTRTITPTPTFECLLFPVHAQRVCLP